MVRPGTFQNKQPPLAGKFPPLAWAQKVDHWELLQETWSGPSLGVCVFGRGGMLQDWPQALLSWGPSVGELVVDWGTPS